MRAQKLTAFDIGAHHPRVSALPNVSVGCAQNPQPGHLCRLVVTEIRSQVETDAGPRCYVGHANELQMRTDTRCRPQPRQIIGHLLQGPIERLVSEPGHGPNIRTTDDHRSDRPGVLVDLSRLLQARDQFRLMGRRGGGDLEVCAVLQSFWIWDGDDIDGDGDRVRQDKSQGFNVGHTRPLTGRSPIERFCPEPAKVLGGQLPDARCPTGIDITHRNTPATGLFGTSGDYLKITATVGCGTIQSVSLARIHGSGSNSAIVTFAITP